MKFAASAEPEELYKELRTRPEGLSQEEVNASRIEHGDNNVTIRDRHRVLRRFLRSFCNVFTLALFCYAFIDLILCGIETDYHSIWDILWGGMFDPVEGDWLYITIIVSLIVISGLVSFIQDTRSTRVADKLASMVSTTATVIRDDGEQAEIDSRDLVVGDIIYMDSGDLVPADVRIVDSKHLKINQSTLTGESDAVSKAAKTVGYPKSVLECPNLVFMGTTVSEGSATAVVVNVGDDTLFGLMAGKLSGKKPKTAYDKGTAKVVKLLLTIMVCMIPPVIAIMICKDPSWTGVMEAIKYAIALAVGLMPEMLSTIITANLAKGAMSLARQKVIVKDMTSVQGLGSIDVLCSDKTGTLTQNKISVKACVNTLGGKSERIELLSALNSSNLSASTNQIDWAIDEYVDENRELLDKLEGYEYVNDVPFDFIRRRATVIVKRKSDDMQFLISKGALQEMLSISSTYENENGEICPLTENNVSSITGLGEWYSTKGMRVLGVAIKPVVDGTTATSADENDLVFVGLIVFTDPVKPSAAGAVKDLHDYGIQVKVLTGDNEFVTRYVCDEIALPFDNIVIGSDIDAMSDEKLVEVVENNNVFARLTPDNKSRIVRALRAGGHSVGMLGDGINDSVAIKEADVGISVDTGADIAKESADLILLDKDLRVLKDGAIQGRCVYANACKYVKMIGSINFGYMFSLIMGSLLFDFEPIGALQILVFNLVNDVACMFIAWDHVEDEYVRKPRNWDPKNLRTVFMGYGPVCCITDIISFAFFAFVVLPNAGVGITSGWEVFTGGINEDTNWTAVHMFQTLWCVEQFWMQVWAIHIVRNNKMPFFQAWSAPILVCTTIIALAIGTLLPFTSFGLSALEMVTPPLFAFVFMPCIGATYFFLSHLAKRRVLRKHGFFAC